MKQLSIGFVLLFGSIVVLHAQTKVNLALNLQPITQEELVSKVMCYDQADTLMFTFDSPADSLDQHGYDYVWQGVEIWGQVNMGKPVRLGKLPDQEGPYHIIPQDWIVVNRLPPGQNAIRMTVRVRRVLIVEGNQVKKVHHLIPDDQNYLFSVVRSCQ